MASLPIAVRPRPRIRIAICGGGIGGLSLAVVLNKYCSDVQIDLYEAAPQFTEIGAGISVWKRTWFIMQLLGLDASLGKMTVKPPVDALSQGFVFRKSDQEEQGFNFHPMMVPYGSITLHRADMLKVLSDNLLSSQNLRTHFSKRLVSYEQTEQNSLASGGVTLHFLDGSSAQADLLVGADGIKSATRATMYTRLAELAAKEDAAKSAKLRSYVNASWSGTYAYRALVETEKLLRAAQGHQAASSSMMYCGKDKHVVSYPISQGRLVNLVAFVTVPGGDGKDLDGPAVVDVSKQEMLECYKGWEPEVQQLLDCVDNPSRWTISHIRDLPSYADGRVALLGNSVSYSSSARFVSSINFFTFFSAQGSENNKCPFS
ncbi:hypothetical protein DFH11DRAFT_11993 [Phellopilus nigrolimitatus]|nr:hypothetical protein DFH11DRAFT_11993 [Phellopilus nigrolimitatus]